MMQHARSLNVFSIMLIVAFIGLAAAFVRPMPNADTPERTRNACLWDYDTLRYEAKGMPSTIEAITGRFDRFPALYYEMRLERVSGELQADPTRLDLYDDAGVACDRLGQHDEAIEWMAHKRERLDAQPDEEHEYRYLANLGTFYAHRWIAGGGDRSDLADLEAAERLITHAIELNPDAHFGRERYQLLAIRWLLNVHTPDQDPPGAIDGITPSLFDMEFELMGWADSPYRRELLAQQGYTDAVEGLTGLIVQGAAWESVDIFFALNLALMDQGDAFVAYIARKRFDELRSKLGKTSLHPAFPGVNDESFYQHSYIDSGDESDLERFYKDARREADAWRESRHEYLLSRLGSGVHPDGDPEFWSEWSYASEAPVPPGSKRKGSPVSMVEIAVMLSLFLAGVGIVTLLTIRVIRWVFA